MRETDRAAMVAKLEALGRVIDAAQHMTPFSHEATERADKDALSRIRRLLTEVEREARNMRYAIEPPTGIARAQVATVPVAPVALPSTVGA